MKEKIDQYGLPIPPKKWPNNWGGSEYPLNYEFYDYNIDPSELPEGSVVGEANTIGPQQVLIWDGVGVVGISMEKYTGS